MSIRVQVRVLEPRGILQPEPQHSIKTDVGDPNERDGKNRTMARRQRIPGQRKRNNIRMNCVIANRSNTSIGEVAEHSQIRRKKQQSKLKPAAAAPMKGQKTEGEDRSALKMQEWSRGHEVCVALPYQIFSNRVFSGCSPRVSPPIK